MTHLNAQQLAFLLDIKKEDAKARMCNAWEKSQGIKKDPDDCAVVGGSRNEKKKIVSEYPELIQIDILAEHLNIPTLPQMVDDIVHNYLNRSASKKFILCDLPEKAIEKAKKDGVPPKFAIPPALRSMLPHKTQIIIWNEWRKRYPKYFKSEEEVTNVSGS